ncbi:MAG: PD-(D/E)XK nuclease family protein [Gammaproteobacteria bacterium]
MYLLRFAELSRAGPAIVVPGAASARALGLALGLAERAAGKAAWLAPVVTSWPGAVAARHELDQLAGAAGADTFLLSTEQELALWQQVLAADEMSALGAPAQAAPAAAAAWRLARLWRVHEPGPAHAPTADTAAYARWAATFRQRLAALGAVDGTTLMLRQGERGVVAAGRAHGFVDPAPALAAWLGEPAAAAVALPRGDPFRYHAHAYADRAQELAAALAWAASVADAEPAARVVVALDDLGQAESVVRRVLRDVLGDDHACHLGRGRALADEPVFRALVGVLEIKPVLRWDRFSAWLRHGAIAGAGAERAARALLDARLRARERHELPLAEVLAAIGDDAALATLRDILEALLDLHARAPRRQPMVGWLGHFEACLAAAGWPGVAAGDELAVATRRAWTEVCDRLYRLDAVLPAPTRAEALQRLRQALAETTVATPTPRQGIFVVTPETALALAPTHLWLAGCESGLLVNAARPSPFLPIAGQRAVGVPGADPGRDLWRARCLVELLAGEGVEHHASFAAGEGDERFTPSPLLPGLARTAVTPRTARLPRGWRLPTVELAAHDDSHGPALVAGHEMRGGTAVFAAQSACPFRAFARHRLGAGEVEEPRPGLSARARGTLVHRCLAEAWGLLGDAAALDALDADGRRALAARAVGQGLRPLRHQTALEREVHDIEQARLIELVERWLEFERSRGAFEVVAREQGEVVDFGGLRFGVRIDRVDRLADGGLVVVDYKTGACRVADWEPPRMREPQLPFYALAAPLVGVRGVAFAAVDAEQPQWLEVVAADDGWEERVAAWRRDLEALAEEIAGGLATPTPRDGSATCRLCEQAPLCRLAERAGGRVADDDAAASGVVGDD